MLLGGHLSVMIGPKLPLPAPPDLTEAIESVSVTHNDTGRSGFQIVLQVGRSGPADLLDYPLVSHPLLRTFNRVILTVTLGVIPQVLMDGVITTREFSPGDQPGDARLTLTGEDISVMMDLEKKRAQFPALSDVMIAAYIIASYSEYGLVPVTIPPLTTDQPVPVERIPVYQGTDLEILREIAGRAGWVFFVEPGPTPGVNLAYWGPPPRGGVPQRALSVNMGAETNVSSLSFSHNGLAATEVRDEIQADTPSIRVPVRTFAATRVPPLAAIPELPAVLGPVRTSLLEPNSGLSPLQAYGRAQSMTDQSVDNVVTVQGELNAARYGDVLRPRKLVGLRGAGWTNDGFYYVKSVSHSIKKGQYTQRFTLTREGVGALTPVVIP